MVSSISVAAIIPTYNCGRYLPEAVESVRRQTYPISEIVIVDDGSNDGTEQIVSRLGSDIRYITQTNAGPSAARNNGVNAATSDWVAFLDADDIWLPEKTERQIELIEKHPELALVATNRTEVDATGEVLLNSLFEKHRFKDCFEQLAGDPIPNALAMLIRANFVPTSSALVNRKVFLELQGFNTNIRFSEDLELWCRIASSHPVGCLPTVQSLYRRHDSNAVGNIEKMLEGIVQTMVSLRHDFAPALKSQGLNPDALVAEHLAAWGYWLFDQGRYSEAKTILSRSMSEHFNKKALIYGFASSLPEVMINSLRRLKQNITG